MMKKKPQPADLVKAKKQREEEERRACLPPGMVNHGNTCFLNSTLQGLFATPLLHELLRTGEISRDWRESAGSPILLRRSPLLTNGHRFGAQYEQAWVEGMPLGDIFLLVMKKAWRIQASKRREDMSPKDIQLTIGRKYDQYVSYQQQDAHEFLRHLLDAMRMEEIDIIKRRQHPSPPKPKRHKPHRTSTIKPTSDPPQLLNGTSSSPHVLPNPNPNTNSIPPPPEGADKLESFVDMIFGGKFASILVCEKCKKVSLAYEDFNDLSLSIKPEDYVRERKRDRLKQLAKKFRFRTPASPGGKQLGLSVPMYRSSSVPASPSRRSNDATELGTEEPPESADTRRKSFEHSREDSNKSSEEETKTPSEPERPSEETEDGFVKVKSQPESEDGDISEGTTRGGEVTFQEPDIRIGRPKEKAVVETKKEKEDPWGKLSRRISTSMRMGKKEKRLSRSTDRGALPPAEPASAPPTPRKPSKLSSAIDSGSDIADVPDTATKSRGISPSPAFSPSPLATPPPSISTSFPGLRRATTEPPRAKSPRPPKPSREEAAYLRRILADVHPSTPSAFSLLQQALSGAATTVSPVTAQSLLSKLTHLPGVEECLRMFTAVEIMEGDNMVGCHRCWKIANGTYKHKHHDEGEECEDDERDSGEVETGQGDGNGNPEESIALPVTESGEISPPDSSPDLGKISPVTTAFSSSQSPSTIFLHDDASLSSAPTSLGSIQQPSVRLVTPAPVVGSSTSALLPIPISIPIPIRGRQANSPPAHVTTFGGLPIPSISTTGPESPSSQDPSPALVASRRESDAIETPPLEFTSFGISLSNDSLLTPRARRISRSSKESKGGSSVGDNSSDSSDDGESFASSASDASGSVSPYSDTSPAASPHSSLEKLRSTLGLGQVQNEEEQGRQGQQPLKPTFNRSQTAHPVLDSSSAGAGFSPSLGPPKIPKSQQVIMRRTYKRYLIASPPPVLVVHLKRFQQISRTYAMSFSTGFKKLDEFIAFPEFLDLTPFLAPKREDFGLSRKMKAHKGKKEKKSKEKEKGANGSGKVKEEKCMYRLYAVVVHIGNMLGGHYVAYTALPPERAQSSSPVSATPESEDPSSATSSTPSTPTTQSDAAEKVESARQPRQWAYISDRVVRLTTIEEVLKAKAYICMYERI